MHSLTTLPAKRAPRPNLDGGKPVRPTILALEGHVEEIVLLKDDSQLFRRAALSILHLASHIEEAQLVGDEQRMNRALTAQRKLAQMIAERSKRLDEFGIPEVQACYSALEDAVR